MSKFSCSVLQEAGCYVLDCVSLTSIFILITLTDLKLIFFSKLELFQVQLPSVGDFYAFVCKTEQPHSHLSYLNEHLYSG